MAKIATNFASGHPDIQLPSPQEVVIGTAFTAAVPETAEGWNFEGWFTDRQCTIPWVDGTVINEDLDLFGKWTEVAKTSSVNFKYTSNSEDESAALPEEMAWPINTKIFAYNLPELPVPTSATTNITGWYIDAQGEMLIDENGILVSEAGLTLYAKSESSAINSVSFAYAVGRLDPESDSEFPMPLTATAAWDAETLDDDNVLPDIKTGKVGEIIVLPAASEMPDLFAGTEVAAEFKGWYPAPLASGTPLTSVILGEEDQVVYALYEQKQEPEFVDITYKVANTYVPVVDESGAIEAGSEEISLAESISLMPDIPCEYIGDLFNGDEAETEISDYEWHDKAIKGSSYKLALPDNTTERTSDFVFGGYYKDINCSEPLDSEILELNEDLVVYVKLVHKPEVVLPSEDLPKTYNISYAIDGFASGSDTPSGGLMPPDLKLPDAVMFQPVDIDKEAFPDLIDKFTPAEMPACEGFVFKGWYFYNEFGEKVFFDPEKIEIKSDLVLHPEFELLDLDNKTVVQLVALTPDMTVAPEELAWQDVPERPFAGMTNPMTVSVGSTFNVSDLDFTDLDTFEVSGFYTLSLSGSNPTLVPFRSGVINSATTLYVQFKSTIDNPIEVIYHMPTDEFGEVSEENKLIEPDFDIEYASSLATTTTPEKAGFGYEQRPEDLFALVEKIPAAANGAFTIITGYYSDAGYTRLFDPNKETKAGETVEIYCKTESSENIPLTVDYIPRLYSIPAGDFKFEIPTAPELPMSEQTATTYSFEQGTSGEDILATIGQPPIMEFWEPKIHEYNNCYWYSTVLGTISDPLPFNPNGFILTEPIVLYPQFTADMSYPKGLLKRDDIKLELTNAVSNSAAASVSSN